MSNDPMLDEFFHEAFSLFEEAEDAFIKMEKGEDFEGSFNASYRCFHSIKGAAGMFGLERLQEHMHYLESLMDEGKSQCTPALIDHLLLGIDIAKEIIESKPESPYDYLTLDQILNPGAAQAETAPTEENATEAKKVEVKQEQVEKIATRKKEKAKKIEERKKGLVYIVDDEADICELLEGILEDEDFGIKTFTNPLDVLKGLEEDDPELILSDIKMPEMTGLELLVKCQKIKPKIPIVLVSGYMTVEDCIQALADGASGFVQKPFNADQIINISHNAINNYRAYKLLNLSIDCLIYQFSDLEKFLFKMGKENVRNSLKHQLGQIMEQRELLANSVEKKAS